jgi:hypothetical protein
MFETALEKSRNFILCNARLLERRLFAHLFDGGAREPVLSALQAYQNPDGGFGSGLEPDKRCETSQPVDVEFAFHVLDLIDAFDTPMVARACDYLSSITTLEGGVPFAVAGVELAPHTPWWVATDPPQASHNPTGSLAGLLLKHGVKHAWVTRASNYMRGLMPGFHSNAYHDVVTVVPYLQYCPEQDWAQEELRKIRARLSGAPEVALDPNAQGYAQFPIDYAPSPASPLRAAFSEEQIQIHLRALAERQQPDGGWPITWQAVGPGAEQEWRGRGTIEALLVLRAYR